MIVKRNNNNHTVFDGKIPNFKGPGPIPEIPRKPLPSDKYNWIEWFTT